VPTAAQIMACNSTLNFCGNVTFAFGGSNITYNAPATNPLIGGTSYTIWATCKKAVANTNKYTAVIAAYNFTTTGTTPSNTNTTNTTTNTTNTTTNTTNTTTNTTNTTNTTTSSSFITIGLAMIVSLFFLF
jgi:hypothetical protein